ncbi:hypothetical protein HIM_02533 [Hirsutella minnesotensis 3608]|nr:hypothetical protein HIM_02533 [Hirsutella minnesotensis 3608]
MAAVSSPTPPLSASSGGDARNHGSLHAASAARRLVDDRHVKSLPPQQQGNGSTARLREAPVSPVRVNFQTDNWAEPSNADIELVQSPAADGTRPPNASSRAQKPLATPTRSDQSSPTAGANEASVSAIKFSDSSLDLNLSPTSPDCSAATVDGPRSPAAAQQDFRNSRESDATASSAQQPASLDSSAATSSSSVSAANDNADGTNSRDDDSPRGSVATGQAPRNFSVPLFQYHHQQLDPPPRSGSVASEAARSSSIPEQQDAAGPVRRHLTPNSSYWARGSMSRPQSSYSTFSDHGSRGRSPNLVPGGAHMRAPSAHSRNSPDSRMSTYAELLNVPYPQQAPAPVSLDNSNLRTVVGNNASLLSTNKTLEMYRQNVKKTNDFSIQYSFAVFLISTAQEQGLDFSEPKTRKNGRQGSGDTDAADASALGSSPLELVREARQILQRLANGGYPFAQYYLADGYASGLFSKGKEDYNSAFPLFVLAAKHGHAESAYRTALCYEFGWGCRKDPAKAVQFLRSAASKRHPGAMTRLGKACLSGDLGEKRYREGIKWMKLAAEAADLQYNAAPYQLGCLYETGYGDDIFQDLSYAAELFTQAAELGHPEANYRMGDAYEHGRLNCPKDPALSVHFYTGAAERSHAAAMMGLCAWYMVGAAPILEKDEEEAYEWAHRSAQLGYVKAQYAVGYFTEMGIGCRRDMLEANVWYVKAADGGDERAKQRLAVIHSAATGGGIPMEVAPPRSGKLTKSPKDDKDCVIM